MGDLNDRYHVEPALHQLDADQAGFRWMDCDDSEHGVVAFCRFAKDPADLVLCVCSFTPVVRRGYRVGVPRLGYYSELVNTDSGLYVGSDVGNAGGVLAEEIPWHGQPYSVQLTLRRWRHLARPASTIWMSSPTIRTRPGRPYPRGATDR